eukprot:GEMP01028975.1.p1 GENE.GEMP01028975.1~~GEMP01028975.1.p1  ORF type:complete len:376 (+),score=98.41 GEMP01028975.1:30-1130(+)
MQRPAANAPISDYFSWHVEAFMHEVREMYDETKKEFTELYDETKHNARGLLENTKESMKKVVAVPERTLHSLKELGIGCTSGNIMGTPCNKGHRVTLELSSPQEAPAQNSLARAIKSRGGVVGVTGNNGVIKERGRKPRGSRDRHHSVIKESKDNDGTDTTERQSDQKQEEGGLDMKVNAGKLAAKASLKVSPRSALSDAQPEAEETPRGFNEKWLGAEDADGLSAHWNSELQELGIQNLGTCESISVFRCCIQGETLDIYITDRRRTVVRVRLADMGTTSMEISRWLAQANHLASCGADLRVVLEELQNTPKEESVAEWIRRVKRKPLNKRAWEWPSTRPDRQQLLFCVLHNELAETREVLINSL